MIPKMFQSRKVEVSEGKGQKGEVRRGERREKELWKRGWNLNKEGSSGEFEVDNLIILVTLYLHR